MTMLTHSAEVLTLICDRAGLVVLLANDASDASKAIQQILRRDLPKAFHQDLAKRAFLGPCHKLATERREPPANPTGYAHS